MFTAPNHLSLPPQFQIPWNNPAYKVVDDWHNVSEIVLLIIVESKNEWMEV